MKKLGVMLLLALASGCGKKEEAPAKGDAPTPTAPAAPAAVVQRLRVQDLTPADRRPAPLDADQLAKALREQLAAAGLPSVDKPGDDVWRLAVTANVVYGIAVDDGIAATAQPGAAKARWEVELKARPPGMSEAMYSYVDSEASAPFAGDAGGLEAALRAQALAGLKPVTQALSTRVRALAQPVPALITQLADPNPEVRLASASRLGMLRTPDAVQALAARIPEEKDREVLLRMVGALAEIGDDRAATALIGLANPRDRELLRAVVDALSVIGGERVNDFLDILATHDAADVREMVEQARGRLERRQPRPAAGDAGAEDEP